MAAIDPAKIEDHKAKLGSDKVHHLKAGEYEILVRSPGRAQWRRFMQTSAVPERRADAIEMLARDCLLEPSAKDFDALLEERPALGLIFGEEVANIAGIGLAVEKNA